MTGIEILCLIDELIKAHGYPPTRMEISKLMGSSSVNASQHHLKQLNKKGLINVRPNVSRGIVITEKGKEEIAKSRENSNASESECGPTGQP